MRQVVVTGLGFISSIGNSKDAVLQSLKECKSGIELFDAFDKPEIPIKIAGTIKGFTFPSADREDWTFPAEYKISREQLRSMSPNALFGYCAMTQAIADAKLTPDLVSNPRTSIMSASAGSIWMCYETSHTLVTRGAARINPMGIVSGIAGTLNFNLATCFKIKGGSVGYVSACASSAHAIGHAVDLIVGYIIVDSLGFELSRVADRQGSWIDVRIVHIRARFPCRYVRGNRRNFYLNSPGICCEIY